MEKTNKTYDEVLNQFDESVLNKMVESSTGETIIARDYLIKEVLPLMDGNYGDVFFRNGLVLSFKDFIEDAVLCMCQIKYNGDFVRFASENMVRNFKKSESKKNIQERLIDVGEIYAFYEDYNGPFHRVTIRGNEVVLDYKDGDFIQVIEDEDDKKDFLEHIYKLDRDLFLNIQRSSGVFKNYVSKIAGDVISQSVSSRFDEKIDEGIKDLESLIDETKSYFADGKKESAFDIRRVPSFDVSKCVKIIFDRGKIYYSEFGSSVKDMMDAANFIEKSEYLVEGYLAGLINKCLKDYLRLVDNNVKNKIPVKLQTNFISFGIEDMLFELRKGLMRVFVSPNGRDDEVSLPYIDIALNDIRKYIDEYEASVNDFLVREFDLINVQYECDEDDIIKSI